MKFLSFLIAAIVFSLSLIAQQPAATGKGRITGRILDSATQSPVEYATITLYTTGNTKPLNGTTTNTKGVFTIDGVIPGSYTITIGFIGYQSRSTGTLTLEGKTLSLSLGDLLLSKRPEALQAVTDPAKLEPTSRPQA